LHCGGNLIKEKLLILPGFIVGILSLMIITYRTILAFLDENKVITISINKYGEQYLDIIALVAIWSVCMISLFFLVKTLRQETFSNKDNNNFQKQPVLGKENNFLDLNPEIKLTNRRSSFIGYLSKSYGKVKQRFKEKE